MVKTKKGLVFLTCVFSTIAVILSFISLGTEDWVVAKGKLILPGYENEQASIIKYGLFGGTIFLFHTRTYYGLTSTCIINENVCAYLCKSTAEDRELELRNLYNGRQVVFDMTCPQVSRLNPVLSPLKGSEKSNARHGNKRVFLNAALYISTVVFLCISIGFGVISASLSFWNTIASPTEACLNMYGLYVYNIVACVTLLVVIVVWGIHFGTIIIYNVGILFTIQEQMDTQGYAELGYSYWLLLPVLLFYLTSLLILYIRHYLLSEDLLIKIQLQERRENEML